jgi:hypothetical protein
MNIIYAEPFLKKCFGEACLQVSFRNFTPPTCWFQQITFGFSQN